MNKVAVIILNFKVKDETIKCVESVLKSSYKNIDIIVVDNDSEDGSAQVINNFPQVDFIQTGKNLGYTGGNNIGINRALAKAADYIFILNPDATIQKDTIENLVKVAQNSEAGIFGPRILFGDRKTIWYAGGIIDLNNVLGIHRGLDEKDKKQYETIEETGFVSGAAMFVKTGVFKQIGLFDERYFLYLEDMELCFRARKAGIRIMYVPKAVVYHENAKSTGLGSPLQDYYITRNRLLFAFKYLSWQKRLVLLKHIFLTMNFSTRRQALVDFLIGRLGKGSFNP